jgi:hypothetical protein
MAVSNPSSFVVFIANDTLILEHIPSPFSNARNVVIKQPVGDYPFICFTAIIV